MIRAKRAGITPAQAAKWDDLILIRFQQVDLPFMQQVLSFFPAEGKGEPETFLLTRYLQFLNPGLQVAFPKTGKDGGMEAIVPQDDDAFEQNSYGIAEPTMGELLAPEAIDLVLVPLLAFDGKGNRAGYGKGYYDRFLLRCRPDCLKVGISYFEAVDLLEDANEFDIPLDLCITPQKVYVF